MGKHKTRQLYENNQQIIDKRWEDIKSDIVCKQSADKRWEDSKSDIICKQSADYRQETERHKIRQLYAMQTSSRLQTRNRKI